MKRTLLLALIALSVAVAGQQSDRKISMVYTDTDAAYVLQAISKSTGESILYSNKNKVPITINLAVDTVDQAIKAISSAAGLVARKVGDMYVVAPAEAMKDALSPYSRTVTFNLDPGLSDAMATKVQTAFPYATVRAIGDRISFTGIDEDVREGSQMISDLVRAQRALRPPVHQLIKMQHVYAEDIVQIIKGIYPGLQVFSTTSSGRPAASAPPQGGDQSQTPVYSGPANFGDIVLMGPEEIVQSAHQMIEELDAAPPSEGPNRFVIEVYKLKYMNGPSLAKFVKSAVPGVDAVAGPEDYSPLRGVFNPLSQQIASAQGTSPLGGGSSGTSTSSTASGGGAAGASGSTTVPGQHVPVVGDRTKTIVIRGPQAAVDAAMKVLAEVDLKPKQVLIDVKVIETNPTSAEQLGISYTFSPVNFYEVAPGTGVTTAAGAVALSSGTTQSLAPSSFSRTPFNFQTQLNALVTKSLAKLLATPSLQVIDNDSGSIFVGNTTTVELTTSGTLGAVSQTIVDFPVGIILLMSPRINADGTVTLHVNPVVSTITSINSQGLPQTAAREAETTMIVKDGETMVLGGLIQDQDSRTVSSVPFLSAIPLIGELFKNRTSSRNRDEILVSITPHIIKDTPEETK